MTKMTRVMATLLMLWGLISAGPAAAQYPPSTGDLVVESTVLEPGSSMEVSGAGFCGGAPVDLTLKPRDGGTGQALATFTADDQGQFSGAVTIPQDTPPGEYTLEASGASPPCPDGVQVLSAGITVRSAAAAAGTARTAGGAALTGIEALPWLIAAGLLILGGAAVVAIVRKRRAGRA